MQAFRSDGMKKVVYSPVKGRNVRLVDGASTGNRKWADRIVADAEQGDSGIPQSTWRFTVSRLAAAGYRVRVATAAGNVMSEYYRGRRQLEHSVGYATPRESWYSPDDAIVYAPSRHWARELLVGERVGDVLVILCRDRDTPLLVDAARRASATLLIARAPDVADVVYDPNQSVEGVIDVNKTGIVYCPTDECVKRTAERLEAAIGLYDTVTPREARTLSESPRVLVCTDDIDVSALGAVDYAVDTMTVASTDETGRVSLVPTTRARADAKKRVAPVLVRLTSKDVFESLERGSETDYRGPIADHVLLVYACQSDPYDVMTVPSHRIDEAVDRLAFLGLFGDGAPTDDGWLASRLLGSVESSAMIASALALLREKGEHDDAQWVMLQSVIALGALLDGYNGLFAPRSYQTLGPAENQRVFAGDSCVQVLVYFWWTLSDDVKVASQNDAVTRHQPVDYLFEWCNRNHVNHTKLSAVMDTVDATIASVVGRLEKRDTAHGKLEDVARHEIGDRADRLFVDVFGHNVVSKRGTNVYADHGGNQYAIDSGALTLVAMSLVELEGRELPNHAAIVTVPSDHIH